jgi:general secretion pathway protein B
MTAPTGDTTIGPGTSGLPAQRPASAGEPVALSSLPMEQKRRFPGLVFSTHIYAEEADLRAIVVNGIRLQEGDRVENLRLEEITEEGAVFAFENQLVSVSVLETWN